MKKAQQIGRIWEPHYMPLTEQRVPKPKGVFKRDGMRGKKVDA